MNKILSSFSYILHPIFIPFIVCCCYFIKTDYYFHPAIVFMFLLQIVLITVVIPLFILLFFIAFKKIDSINIYENKQRRIPIVLIFTLISYYVFTNEIIEYSTFLKAFFTSIGLSVLCSFIGTFFKFKISLHMLGVTVFTVFYLLLNILYKNHDIVGNSICILLIGIVASSRLQLNAHTFFEVCAGFLVSLFICFFVLFYYYNM